MASGKRRDVAADGDEQRFVKKQTLTRPVNEELSCNFGIQIMERGLQMGLQMDNDRLQMDNEKCAKQKAKIAVLKSLDEIVFPRRI